MYEVELKVRADHDRVRTRLSECGGQFLGAVRQEDTYYDAPDRDFAETDEALRVRAESTLSTGGSSDRSHRDGDAESVFLTYKGPLVDADSKTREEYEITVEDDDAIRGILSGLGYGPAATVTKERERYELDGCTVTLDHVAGVGEFVEVELETAVANTQETEAAIDAAREQAIEILDRLGLDADDQIRTSYLGLVLAAREEATGADSTTDG
ncbi:class IV adenylate cyclase [Halovenus marina]|uniref:class IV adenylate cyclase n=1 Tax=Halovenus marina TaxID=3396621 RepID=UPI003F57C07C